MAFIPRHTAGQAFSGGAPILGSIGRQQRFDFSGNEKAHYQVADALRFLGEAGQAPLLPADMGAAKGRGMQQIGQAIASFGADIGRMQNQMQSAQQIRATDEADMQFDQVMSDFNIWQAENEGRPEMHPAKFDEMMNGLNNSLKSNHQLKGSPVEMSAMQNRFQSRYLKEKTRIMTGSARAMNEQAVQAGFNQINRGISDLDIDKVDFGLNSLRGHLSDEKIEEMRLKTQQTFQREELRQTDEAAFVMAENGDLEGAKSLYQDFDWLKPHEIEGKSIRLEKAYGAGNSVREITTMISNKDYKGAEARLSEQNPDGTYVNDKYLPDDARADLLAASTQGRLKQMEPLISEAIKDKNIRTPEQIRELFAENDQVLEPRYERIISEVVTLNREGAHKKMVDLNREVDAYSRENDPSGQQAELLKFKLENSGLTEDWIGGAAERLGKLIEGDPEQVSDSAYSLQTTNQLEPRILKTKGEVFGDRVKTYEDPGTGETVFYVEATASEIGDGSNPNVMQMPTSGGIGSKIATGAKELFSFGFADTEPPMIRVINPDDATKDRILAGEAPSTVVDQLQREREYSNLAMARDDIDKQRKAGKFSTPVEVSNYIDTLTVDKTDESLYEGMDSEPGQPQFYGPSGEIEGGTIESLQQEMDAIRLQLDGGAPSPTAMPGPTQELESVSNTPPPVPETGAGPVKNMTVAKGVSYDMRTRDEIDKDSTVGSRMISLDYNSSDSGGNYAMIVIPNDSTDQEREAAQAYVDGVTKWFRANGVNVDNPVVKTTKENGRGVGGFFHTEPAFVENKEAMQLLATKGGEYASILSGTLGQIDGSTFIAPHKANDPGASGNGFPGERDFARKYILPHLANPKAGMKPGQSKPIAGKVTAYSPQKGASDTHGAGGEGSYAASRPGPDGEAVVRTLDDYAEGRSKYITLAGSKDLFGKKYTIPRITYTDSEGKETTLENVTGVVHDTGSAFDAAEEGRFDIPIGRDMDQAAMHQNHATWESEGIEFIPVNG